MVRLRVPHSATCVHGGPGHLPGGQADVAYVLGRIRERTSAMPEYGEGVPDTQGFDTAASAPSGESQSPQSVRGPSAPSVGPARSMTRTRHPSPVTTTSRPGSAPPGGVSGPVSSSSRGTASVSGSAVPEAASVLSLRIVSTAAATAMAATPSRSAQVRTSEVLPLTGLGATGRDGGLRSP